MQFLLGDIGGTNARFALASETQLGTIEHAIAADHFKVGDAVTAFLARQGVKQDDVAAAVLAVAGPIAGERCMITNSHWIIDAAELRKAFGFKRVRLINDFEAVALSLPHFAPADLTPLGGGKALAGEPMVVLGPGTGFGAAALIHRDGQAIPIATEGGHATLAAGNKREDAILEYLRGHFGHVSVERAVSGMGLENLYQAIAAIDGISVPKRDPTHITKAGLSDECPVSRLALEMFAALLGSVAGNLALTFRACGGVFIAGGIAPRMPDFLKRSEFRDRFEGKGRFRDYLERIPTSIIMHPNPSFPGLKALAGTMT